MKKATGIKIIESEAESIDFGEAKTYVTFSNRAAVEAHLALVGQYSGNPEFPDCWLAVCSGDSCYLFDDSLVTLTYRRQK